MESIVYHTYVSELEMIFLPWPKTNKAKVIETVKRTPTYTYGRDSSGFRKLDFGSCSLHYTGVWGSILHEDKFVDISK